MSILSRLLRPSRAALLVMASLSLPAAGCASLPSAAMEVAENATSFEVMTLDPGQEGAGNEDFHGHRVLWRTLVTDAATQDRILGIVNGGVSSFATQAKCFNPRHGVRATQGARSVDLVICYECSSIQVRGTESVTQLATNNVQADLDKEFEKLGSAPPK